MLVANLNFCCTELATWVFVFGCLVTVVGVGALWRLYNAFTNAKPEKYQKENSLNLAMSWLIVTAIGAALVALPLMVQIVEINRIADVYISIHGKKHINDEVNDLKVIYSKEEIKQALSQRDRFHNHSICKK
jgi:hypothetical protein